MENMEFNTWQMQQEYWEIKIKNAKLEKEILEMKHHEVLIRSNHYTYKEVINMPQKEKFDIDKLINNTVKISKQDVDELLDNLSANIQIAKFNINKHPGIAHISLQNIIYKANSLHKYIEWLKETPLE